MRVLSLVLLLTSCGPDSPTDWHNVPWQKDPPPVKAEEPIPQLKEILDNFLYDYGVVYKADVSSVSKLEFIRYGNPATKENPNQVGVCWTWSYNSGAVYKSNITVMEMDTATSIRALLYHELGHCVLGLDHTTQESKTMMSPTMHDDMYYEENWDILVKDMCNRYSK